MALHMTSAAGEIALKTDPLIATVQCESSAKCEYRGRPIRLTVTLTNRSGNTVQIPLDYLRRRGPYLQIFDRTTGRSRTLRVGFGRPALREIGTSITPGESFSLAAMIAPTDIAPFFETRFDNVEVEITVPVTVRVNQETTVDFRTPYFLKIHRGDYQKVPPLAEKVKKELSEKELDNLMDK